ncbi:MAG: hypothetical protein J6A92_05930 [Lachnospiraceae bacterium]|nr:hypothetical protein [Lachnospiraceae bacterium]
MKKNYLILLVFVLFILYILTHPAASMAAAADGLLLWYEQILPALLPLAILSNLMVYSNYMQLLTKYLYPVTKHIIPTSANGCFAFLGGIFFGFPMGSKISADLVTEKKILPKEGEILSICCNQLSPIFLSGYLMTSILQMPEYIVQSYIVLYLPPLSYAAVRLRKLHLVEHTSNKKNTASDSHLNFRIIDAGIMNGFETLTKLGGYIILFSIFASMLHTYNHQYPMINYLCTGLIEVTTGFSYLRDSGLSVEVLYPLALFFASFGGFCGFAQTCSMTGKCNFSKSRYLICRLCFAVISSVLGYILFW